MQWIRHRNSNMTSVGLVADLIHHVYAKSTDVLEACTGSSCAFYPGRWVIEVGKPRLFVPDGVSTVSLSPESERNRGQTTIFYSPQLT